MRKRLAVFLAIMMLVSLIAACSSSNKEGSSSQPASSNAGTSTDKGSTPSDEPSSEPKGPPAKLSMIVQSQSAWPMKEDWLVYQLLEEYANVDLDVSGYQGNWWEAIPLIMASGNLPDLMWMSGPDIIHENGASGALVNLLNHMDKMPNLKAWIDQHPEETNALLSADGKLYMTPAQGAYGEWDGLWLYREDIFKNNNIPVPATYDELYGTLKKLKELYPSSFPLYISGFGGLNEISLSFGTSNSFYYNEEGKEWRFGPIEDNYKKAVQFLADAYKDKLIPQEYGNLNAQKRNELVTTDNTFILYGYIGNIDSYNNLVRPNNPSFKMAQFTPPGGDGHEGIHGTKFLFQEGLTVTTTSKNKDAAFAFLDSIFTDEAKELVSWGKEGVTYEKVNGKNQYLPVVKDAATRSVEFGIRTSGVNLWFDNEANTSLFNEETRTAYEEASKHIGPAARSVAFTKDEKDAIKIKAQAIGKYVDENVSKFIVGQKPMSEWDAYVKGVQDLGVNDVLKVYTTAFARSSK